jgi:hypothetical protein
MLTSKTVLVPILAYLSTVSLVATSIVSPISTPVANAQFPQGLVDAANGCVRTECYMGIIRAGSGIRDQVLPSKELQLQRQREQYNQRVNQNIQRALYNQRGNGCLTAYQCQRPVRNGLRPLN